MEQRLALHPRGRRLHLQHGAKELRDQPGRPDHLQREHVRQSGHAELPHGPVHQPAADRWRRDRAPVDLEQGQQPRHVHRPEPGRHRAVRAEELYAAGLHLEEEPGLLAGVHGKGAERLLPRLHVQHGRAVRVVLRANRLDRQLHSGPAEELRQHQPRLPPLLGGARRHQ